MAIKWLARLLKRRPKDAELLSQMGYIQLTIGDSTAAAATFQQAWLLI